MNRLATFVLGIAVGVAATLVLQERGAESAAAPQTARSALAPSTDPAARATRAPEPTPAPIIAAPEAPAVVGAVQAPTLDEALADPRGNVESVVVADDTFLGGPAERLLTGDDFSRYVLSLSRSPSVAAAENHQRLYSEYLQLDAVRQGAVVIQQLACGQRVCAASIAGYDRASLDAVWEEISGRPARGPQMTSGVVEMKMSGGTMMVSTTVMGSNGYERRLLIAVDPAVRSYTTGSIAVDPDP